MNDKCNNCKKAAEAHVAKDCRRTQCGLSLLLVGQDRIKRRYLAELHQNLPIDVLYHCFTGERDEVELERVANLDHVRQMSLLEAVERIWPQRLQQIADERRTETQESKEVVQQFILSLTHDKSH